MKIWIVTVGEPIPGDYADVRLLRTGIQSRLWSDSGNQVTWWNSTVEHGRKVQRFNSSIEIEVTNNYRIILLHGCLYRKNVSIGRIVNHMQVAREFKKLSASMSRPDLILCSYPPGGLCREAVNYGYGNNIPVIIDVRDLWPDAFYNLLPSVFRPLFRPFAALMERNCRHIFGNAAAVYGVTDEFVEWGLGFAGRERTKFDRAVPMANIDYRYSDEEMGRCRQQWLSAGINWEGNNICFFGNLGRQFNMDVVIKAAEILADEGSDICFVICGVGEKMLKYRKKTSKLGNILFPGYVNRMQIRAMMGLSKAGLAPYYSTGDFSGTLSNKMIEYMSGGLPILSGIDGRIGRLIREHDCGVVYEGNVPESLVNAVRLVCGDRDAFNRMSGNSSRLFNSSFRAENVYAGMPETCLKELLNER